MLIDFRIGNYRSIRDEQAINFCSTDSESSNAGQLVVLPTTAIFGANASGKTNLLSGIQYLSWLVRESAKTNSTRWTPSRESFAFDHNRHHPSLFETTVLLNNVRYQYGCVIGNGVREEWLYAWPNGRKQVWFERDCQTFKFGKNLRGPNQALRRKIPETSLFLSFAVQHNYLQLLPLYRWFASIEGISSTTCDTDRRLIRDGRLMFQGDSHRICNILQAFGEEISNINVQPYQDGESTGHRLKCIVQRMLPGKPWLDFAEESTGVKQLIYLAAYFKQAFDGNGLLLLDGSGFNIHPLVWRQIVHLFDDKHSNSSQLIFTTHTTSLLDIDSVTGQSTLRRDQIWFIEKGANGATRVFPLTDFIQRGNSENVRRGYLQGRYGAVPICS